MRVGDECWTWPIDAKKQQNANERIRVARQSDGIEGDVKKESRDFCNLFLWPAWLQHEAPDLINLFHPKATVFGLDMLR